MYLYLLNIILYVKLSINTRQNYTDGDGLILIKNPGSKLYANLTSPVAEERRKEGRHHADVGHVRAGIRH